ncbi:hypothetical protein [Parvularcula sp. LCG005]|uniref:hypothetical protein n=1 Tax=Parvularcula sp. LCG005 TaxID=3078805 RepID=UPI0029428AD5|nr:hypothetical protein [Parvularcula sp. LCG005]WOI54530.1 hypothetical protein RUI03_05915 [Parvularcula sp. LCG005]
MTTADPDSPSSSKPVIGSNPVTVERYRAEEVTAGYRFRQLAGRLADQVLAALGLSLILAPMLLIAALTLDLPLHLFDRFATVQSIRPSLWTSRGEFVLTISLFVMLAMGRRYGATIVGRAQNLSWLVLVVVSSLILLILAPQLTAADMPSGRYMLGVMLGWYAGPLAAIHVYDLTRGSRWWRAPLLACLTGFAVQTAFYFPITYAGTGAPWGLWWAADLVLKTGLSLIFLGVYRSLRRRLKPRTGLGGK